MSDPVLREHGTEFMRLKTQNIMQAAVADLRLIEQKRENKADEGRLYSFMNRHVRRARDPLHLIAMAYFEGMPRLTDKSSTLTIYEDHGLLLDTLIRYLIERREELSNERTRLDEQGHRAAE